MKTITTIFTELTRREQLSYVIGLIEFDDISSTSMKKATEFITAVGITYDSHIGDSVESFDTQDKKIEWLLGQFKNIYNDHRLDLSKKNQYLSVASKILLGIDVSEYLGKEL